MHMAAGLGRVKRAFITGRIIKQFFTPEARKVKKFVPLSAGLGCLIKGSTRRRETD